jgi:hypothetical protein
MKWQEAEREATKYVDTAIRHLLQEHRAEGTPVTAGRIASQAVTRISLTDYPLIKQLAYRQLHQIARSRLSVEFDTLLQAQALATCRPSSAKKSPVSIPEITKAA